MNLGKVGFVLSGGGFSGAYSLGFLKALAVKGVKPDFVQGVSVGTLTSAKYLETLDTEKVEKKWLQIQELGPSCVFNKKEIITNLRGTALFNNRRAYELLIKDIDLEAVVNSPVEYQIVTINDSTKRQEVFFVHEERFKKDPQRLEKVFLAAIGLQGFLPPVLIDGQWHSDGLIFQLKEAVKAKCDTIFVFINNLLPENQEKEFGTERWYSRVIFGLQISNNFLVIKEVKRAIYHGYELVQSNPSPVFEDANDLGLPKRIQRGIKKITSGLKEAAISDLQNVFVKHRIVLLTPPHPIPTLYTIGFRKADSKTCYPGDISSAIEQCYNSLDDEFWKKLK